MSQSIQPPSVAPTPGASLPASALSKHRSAKPLRGAKVETTFFPREPSSLEATGLTAVELGALILKYVQAVGTSMGRQIAEQLRLPVGIVQPVLAELKAQYLVEYRNVGPINDFDYRLTEDGAKRARIAAQQGSYFGSAPVSLNDYIESVQLQSVRNRKVRLSDMRAAFRDLSLPTELLGQIGQAINACRGLLLYGPPGNGKTAIAERVVRSLRQYIWIPRTVAVSGELVRVFDPSFHQEVKLSGNEHLIDELPLDRRWVLIRRPTVVVGAELRMSQLEISSNPLTGVQEAPIQFKSNGGALVVDDLGRQSFRPEELLNRWSVALERGYDFLTLSSGRQISAPFDQMLMLSTNLAPSDVADEALLRRIHYKIELADPTVDQLRELLRREAKSLGLELPSDMPEYLIETHYRAPHRAARFSHPRDLLLHVRSYCEFYEQPFVVTPDALDMAAKNYFAGL